MTLEMKRSELLGLVDADRGVVDRRIFSDEAIYQLEMERIFARAWNFMCHESQIPNPGDFFASYIGEDRVIATRDKNGDIQVLLNTCRHRGNAVCRAEEGHASSFMCTYHGWTYDLQGKLVGVPGLKDFYHNDLDRESWGLIRAQAASYKGFVFATMDPEAPPLDEYLGEVGRIGLSLMAEKGDIAILDGVQKYTIGCNWKLAVDNLFDWYHPQISHASANMSGYNRRLLPQSPEKGPVPVNPSDPMQHLVMLGEYGHAISGPRITDEMREQMAQSPVHDERWRERPETKQELGAVGVRSRGHPNIFPNLWVATGGTQLSLRLPRGPFATEIWWFTLLDRNLPPDKYEAQRQRANHTFGPAGILEQEDGENWDQSTRATLGTISRRYPLHFAMGLGHGEVIEDEAGPPHIETPVNEHAQLWTYRAWAEWMAAESWDDLKKNHSPSPSGSV